MAKLKTIARCKGLMVSNLIRLLFLGITVRHSFAISQAICKSVKRMVRSFVVARQWMGDGRA